MTVRHIPGADIDTFVLYFQYLGRERFGRSLNRDYERAADILKEIVAFLKVATIPSDKPKPPPGSTCPGCPVCRPAMTVGADGVPRLLGEVPRLERIATELYVALIGRADYTCEPIPAHLVAMEAARALIAELDRTP